MNYYKKAAGSYDNSWKSYTNKTLNKLIEQLPASLAGKKLLDYGCGTGELIKRLLIQYPDIAHICGYDPVEEMLRQAKNKIAQFPLQIQQKVKLQTHQNFGSKFDLIVSSSVLHYLPQPEETLLQLKSLLMPEGALVLLDYTKEGLLPKYFEWFFKYIDAQHQKAYQPQQIRQMVEKAGFKTLRDEEFIISPLWKGYVIKAAV